jgi:hypothetical protein
MGWFKDFAGWRFLPLIWVELWGPITSPRLWGGCKNLRCVAPGRFVPATGAATDSGTAGNHLFLAGDAIGSTSSYQANVVKWKESTYLGAGSGTFAVRTSPELRIADSCYRAQAH